MKVTVEYQIRKDYCHCCDQKLPKPALSDKRGFDFTKQDCLKYLKQEYWKTEAEYENELQRIIKEFVYETIQFYAADSDDRILIENDELQKMKTFILKEVIAQS